ncbi:MAG: isochorismate synthase [Burkholderiaceae bacterium]|nr:isochorismate synthase [Burkholderiaceae bacterium]
MIPRARCLRAACGRSVLPLRDHKGLPALWMEPAIAWTGDTIPQALIETEAWYRQAVPEKQTIEGSKTQCQSHEEFCQHVEDLIVLLKQGDAAPFEISKVVWSRALEVQKPEGLDPYAFFQKICQAYPAVHAVLCYHPSLGLWIGASPEILIERRKDCVYTMALAGTRPRPTMESDENSRPWRPKEILEQSLVVRYLQDRFRSLGLVPLTSPTQNLQSGPVEHLHTQVQASTSLSCYQMALDLHPSPAIAGEPSGRALDYLLEHEPHKRELYGGFWGYLDAEGDGRLSVNLRCLRWHPDHLVLYAGAGILADSDPEAEWQETCRKASTLLNLLKPKIVSNEPPFRS